MVIIGSKIRRVYIKPENTVRSQSNDVCILVRSHRAFIMTTLSGRIKHIWCIITFILLTIHMYNHFRLGSWHIDFFSLAPHVGMRERFRSLPHFRSTIYFRKDVTNCKTIIHLIVIGLIHFEETALKTWA